ncbi:MAG: AsmA family protein, partial [Porphyromonadaceae bacterium]|nr:AsmA family protein [Porphyromonadaceae bacterium]
MKFLFRFLKILVVSALTIFLVTAAGAYLLLSISSIQQKIARWGEQELVRLFDTRLSIGSSHIEPFNKIRLTDLCLYDRQGDTLFYAQDVMMGFALQELLQKRLVFTTVQVNDFDISLRRDTPEAPLNLQFILDLFKGDDSPAIDLHSQINTVLVRRGRIRYDVSSLTSKEEGLFDPNHIEVDNFLATVSLKALEKDSLNVNIRKVSFDEKSGFSLQKFGVKVIGNRESILLNNFRITLPNSYIAINKTTTDLLEYRNFDDFLRQSLLDVQVQKSRITLSDFKVFSPRLADIRTPMEITAQVQGTLADLTSSLKVVYGEGEVVFSAEATAQDIFSPQERCFSGRTDELTVSNTALLLQEFIPERPDLIERFAPIGEWRFSGEIDKTPDGVKADGYLSTALGDIEGTVDMDILPEGNADIFHLKGNLKSPDFDIGTFFSAEPVLGQIGLDIDLDLNQRTQGGKLWGEAEGNISHIDFKGYTYQDITFNGNYNDTNFDGLIAVNDPNAQIQLIGSLNLFDERPLIHVSAEGRDIRLGLLNIAPQYAGSSTSFILSSNFSGDHIDNIEG